MRYLSIFGLLICLLFPCLASSQEVSKEQLQQIVRETVQEVLKKNGLSDTSRALAAPVQRQNRAFQLPRVEVSRGQVLSVIEGDAGRQGGVQRYVFIPGDLAGREAEDSVDLVVNSLINFNRLDRGRRLLGGQVLGYDLSRLNRNRLAAWDKMAGQDFGGVVNVVDIRTLMDVGGRTIDGGLYYAIRDVPRTLREMVSLGGFGSEGQSYTDFSGVTGKSRVSVAFGTRSFVTYDQDDESALAVGRLGRDFKREADGNEVIIQMPNGLYLYAATNADKERADAVPQNIAVDHVAPIGSRIIHPIISCLGCHGADGFKPAPSRAVRDGFVGIDAQLGIAGREYASALENLGVSSKNPGRFAAQIANQHRLRKLGVETVASVNAGSGDFNIGSIPLVRQNCSGCHYGPDAEGGLQFDGPISANDVQEAIRRVRSTGGDRMPPRGGNLSADELEEVALELENFLQKEGQR